jgi:hypothetical protein
MIGIQSVREGAIAAQLQPQWLAAIPRRYRAAKPLGLHELAVRWTWYRPCYDVTRPFRSVPCAASRCPSGLDRPSASSPRSRVRQL